MTQGNIYFDYNATTPLDPLVLQKAPEWLKLWGNPSSIHHHGRGPKKVLRESRRTIAQVLGCHPLELIFTSGGSEANNTALQGVLRELRKKTPQKNKVLLGGIEHPSVLQQEQQLIELGYNVVRIPASCTHGYNLEFYQRQLDNTVALVSVMLANNEVGLLAPLKAMVDQAHQVGAYFHSDLVQALGKFPFDLKSLNVDLASFSAHKVYALKGCGLLYIKKGTPFQPLVVGGAQERYRRAGTENLLAIASFALMIEKVDPDLFVHQIEPLRDYFEKELVAQVSGVHILCQNHPRLANTSSLYVEGVSGESLLMSLDLRGFSVSTGAACSSGNPEPSPVLLALGLTHDQAQSSLRVSMGRFTTELEVQKFITQLVQTISHLRSLNEQGGVYEQVL